jgi:DNA-binding NarL/FixJ family response regulator
MRAVLADGEPTVRDALHTLLTQDLGVAVVGDADSAGALLREVESHKPDLVVVAWNLVAGEASARFVALRRSSPGLRIVRPETRQAALEAGADAFISKVDAADQVVRALRMTFSLNELTVEDGHGPAEVH